MRRAERVSAGVVIALGLWVVYLSRDLPYYTTDGPGAGFFPIWLGALFAVVGLIWLLRLLLARPPSEKAQQAPATPAPEHEQEPPTDDPVPTPGTPGETNEPEGLWPGRVGAVRVASVTVVLLAVAYLLDLVGFQLTMLAMVAVLLRTLGRQRILVTAAVSIVASFAVYFVFARWLGVQLPTSQISWLAAWGL